MSEPRLWIARDVLGYMLTDSEPSFVNGIIETAEPSISLKLMACGPLGMFNLEEGDCIALVAELKDV